MAGADANIQLPGFRFHPTDEQLLNFYLAHRHAATRPDLVDKLIPVVDVYQHHPRELKLLAGEANLMDPEQWFFFCPRPSQQPGSNSKRPRRSSSAKLGFWKVTGNKSWVFSSDNKVIGEKRTLAFYEGYATNSSCTIWRMSMYDAPMADKYSVCRVYINTGALRSIDRQPEQEPAAPPTSFIPAGSMILDTSSHVPISNQELVPTSDDVTVTVAANNGHGTSNQELVATSDDVTVAAKCQQRAQYQQPGASSNFGCR